MKILVFFYKKYNCVSFIVHYTGLTLSQTVLNAGRLGLDKNRSESGILLRVSPDGNSYAILINLNNLTKILYEYYIYM